ERPAHVVVELDRHRDGRIVAGRDPRRRAGLGLHVGGAELDDTVGGGAGDEDGDGEQGGEAGHGDLQSCPGWTTSYEANNA
ncbi:MAG TPA: hypothetical protein DEG44_04325, partial [Candidatus Kerfeldbacteria bacterium]|nr:hypothetical protein [Candidatus Kerfeldbacteria bacterium]